MNKQLLKQFYQQNRVMIFPVLTALASLILILVVIYPQLSKLISNNGSYQELIKKNQSLDVKASELQQLDGSKLQQQLNASLFALPAGKDLAETIGLLQSITRQSGFNLDSLEFGANVTSDKGTAFPVHIGISGSRVSLSNLLNNIESSYRPMKVESMDITSSKDSDTVTGSLEINIFYQSIPTSVVQIDAPLPKLTSQEETLISTLAQSNVLTAAPVSTSAGTPSNVGKDNPFE